MTKDGVLVDTSVLIDFLRGVEPNAAAVAALISSRRIYTTGIIIAELLQGTKNESEEAYIAELVDAIPSLEMDTLLWSKAGKLSCAHRRKGITLPLTDIAIAALAIEHDLSLFTIDSHFKNITGVKLHRAT